MKKIFLMIFLLFMVLPFCVAEEKITMRTYFPSSSASYETLSLSPTNTSPDSPIEGELYYDNGEENPEGLYYYDGTEWKMVGAGAGSLWAASGDDIYYNDGDVSIGTDTPDLTLTIGKDTFPYSEGGIIAKGVFGSGANLTTSGDGARFIWYPKKGALRAGYVSGSQWDDDNIGGYSVATGYDTVANGMYSTAFGYDTKAEGLYSTAFGKSTTASGMASTAMGADTIANGTAAIAMGDRTVASGPASATMGFISEASGFAATAIGSYSVASGEVATVIGEGSTADGRYATAIGSKNTATGEASVALGFGAQTLGNYSIVFGSQVKTAAGADYAIVIGKGVDNDNPLENNIPSSLMIGFESTLPTLFVGPGSGPNTLGRVGIGTTDPKSILHIGGDGTIALKPRSDNPSWDSSVWKLYIYDDGVNDPELRVMGPQGEINIITVLTP